MRLKPRPPTNEERNESRRLRLFGTPDPAETLKRAANQLGNAYRNLEEAQVLVEAADLEVQRLFERHQGERPQAAEFLRLMLPQIPELVTALADQGRAARDVALKK
jgi:hypothetical protein